MSGLIAPVLALPGLQLIKEALLVEQRRIVHEVFHYAPPITRCDVQYNTLLEERAAINREVVRLERMMQTGNPALEDIHALSDYIISAAFLDEDTRQRLHALLPAGGPVS